MSSDEEPSSAPKSTREVREAHRFDADALASYLKGKLLGYAGDSLTIRQFRGGQSNPTFWISDGARSWVLRKKPPGVLLPSAHAVEREHRVMAALRQSEVPVAEVYLLCEDPEVIGTPFFVMEHLEGRIFWNVQLPELPPAERAAIYEELARILAALHSVRPEEVGLSGYGKPGGYLTRQVKRWSAQYRASMTGPNPAMEALMEWLPAELPAEEEVTLTHGDFRLDNLIFHPTEARALAVIDWELSTLGHPLADLAYTCMLYDIAMPKIGGLLGVDFEASGIPDERSFVDRYRALTGRGEIANWPYFKAFSIFRLASIAQGVYKRSLQGNASSESADMFGAAAITLSQIACRVAGIDLAR